MTDPRMKQALAEWRQIAPDLGLDATQFRAKLIWQKDELNRSQIVVRLSGPRGLILKRVFDAPDGDALDQGVAALRAAHDRLAHLEKAHAPEVLFASVDGAFVVMTEALGKTLNDHLEAGKPHFQLLKRAGAWLAAFHRSAETEQRRYQPRFMVAHTQRMADAVETGALAVPDPNRFVACCRAIPTLAEAAIDQPTVSATKHGDFNLRNILLGPEGATGLDFKPPSTAPVGFDIARLLMDYAELFQPQVDLGHRALLSDATLDAFFDGYDLVRRDDATVIFLPYVQLLNDWRLIPPRSDKRSWRQKARYSAIEALATTGFGLT